MWSQACPYSLPISQGAVTNPIRAAYCQHRIVLHSLQLNDSQDRSVSVSGYYLSVKYVWNVVDYFSNAISVACEQRGEDIRSEVHAFSLIYKIDCWQNEQTACRAQNVRGEWYTRGRVEIRPKLGLPRPHCGCEAWQSGQGRPLWPHKTSHAWRPHAESW